MFRRLNFYSICFAFGLSVLLILAGSRYTDNPSYRQSSDIHRNTRNFLKIEEPDDALQQSNDESYFVFGDPAPVIDKIINRTRSKIKLELANYNFTKSGVSDVKNLLFESGGQPLRSLIISTWRSGTTFLGEVLNAVPGNYYHYEPLLKYEIIQIRGPPHAEEALNTIKNMLKCNYNGMEDFFNYGKGHLHQFSHNSRLWDHCKYNKELCFDSDFTSRLCKLFPFQSMKVVRLRLRLVQDILQDKTLNVKVVLLIRDPRGVMQSRQHRDFCQPAPDCWNPELLCADMISDYVAAGRLLAQYPDRLMVLRYEELALNPHNVTGQLFKFLNLSPTASVSDFLSIHTNLEAGGVSSTFRVSRDVPFRWKNILEYSYVDQIQTVCQEAMSLWGYNPAYNSSHLASKDFNPLLPYTITL